MRTGFFIPKLDCWVEVVSLTDGAQGNPNSIPKAVSGKSNKYPEDQIILRMCNAFETKAKKMETDIYKDIIKASQPIVLCISGGGLDERLPMYPEGGYPQIVKALLPVGDLRLWLNRKTRKFASREYKYREGVNKITKEGELKIRTEAFLKDSHEHISAVMYSWANAGNPIGREHWGCDFFIVHNPKAKKPLDSGFVKCGKEYPVTVRPDSFTMELAINNEES